jgi:hypothetical protein
MKEIIVIIFAVLIFKIGIGRFIKFLLAYFISYLIIRALLEAGGK